MKSSVETLENNQVKLSVELDPQEFEADLSAMFDRLAREVKLPGFRKGKAPRQVMENRFGREYTRTRALEESLPRYYSEAIRANQVDAIADPEVEITSDAASETVSFQAVVEVRPEVAVAGYGSLRVEIPNPEPTDAEIADEIDRFREHFGTLEPVNRPAHDKDRVTIDLSATYNGDPYEPFEAKDFTYTVGSGTTAFKDFDAQLTGSQVGHIFEFNSDHPQEEGAVVRVKALVKQVQQNNLPELTEEFVRESSEFESVGELTDDLTQRLRGARRQQSARMFQAKAEEALNQLVDAPLPDALVSLMTQQAAQNFARSMQAMGMDLETYLGAVGQTVESFTAAMRAEGEKSAKLDLALRAVAKAESLEVSDEQLFEMYDSIVAQQTGAGDGATETARPDVESLDGLRTEMLKREAFEFVCRKMEIVDESGAVIAYELLFPEEEADAETDATQAATEATEPEPATDPPANPKES